MFQFVKRLAMVVVVATVFGLAFVQYGGVNPDGPFVPVAHGAALTGYTVTSSTATPGATATITLTFTPTTVIDSGQIGAIVSFFGPPESKFGVGNAALGAASSSNFTGGAGITERNSTSGFVRISALSMTAAAKTIVLSGIVLPSISGKYQVQARTEKNFASVDEGNASLQVGTIAVSGKVSKPAGGGGGPAENIDIMARTKDFSKRFFSRTDVNGDYALGIDANGVYIIETMVYDQALTQASLTAADSIEVTYSGVALTNQNFTLKLATKTITGTLAYADGTKIANGKVMVMGRNKPFFAQATTNAAGVYSLKVAGGLEAEARPDTYGGGDAVAPDYAYSGPGVVIKFADNTTPETKSDVSFSVTKATGIITGSISPKPTGFAGLGVFSRGGFGTGVGVQDGSFTAKVPPGTYELSYFQDSSGGGTQYAMPARDPISVKDNETVNLGAITLVEKNRTITAGVQDSASGNGIGGFQVGCFQPKGGGFSHGVTGGDGKALIKATDGEYGCFAFAGFGGEGGSKLAWRDWLKLIETAYAQASPTETRYVVTGGPKFIKVGSSGASVTFNAVKANGTINVTFQDNKGQSLTSIHGFVTAEMVSTNSGGEAGFGSGLGQPVDPTSPGFASLKVPAGGSTHKYNLRMMMPPGAAYSTGDSVTVDMTSATSANAVMTLLPNDATISGSLVDEDNAPVKNVFAFVSAANAKGAFIPGNVDTVNGTYSMEVPSAAGELSLGYHVDPATGYFPQPFTDSKVKPASGSTTSRNIVMRKATTTVNFTVKNPDGVAIPNVLVVADNRIAEKGKTVDAFFGHEEQTDANGKVTLKFPAGTYNFVALLPPETLRNNSWMPPKSKTTVMTKGDNIDITLEFVKADVNIKGQLRDENKDVMADAEVKVYSNDSQIITAPTNSNGEYSVNVTSGDWHVVGTNDKADAGATKTEPLVSDDTLIQTGTNKSVTQDLILEDRGTMSSPVSATFDSDTSRAVSLTDGDLRGAEISFPQDALDLDSQGGNCTVSVETTAEQAAYESLDKPIGSLALEVTAQDATGTPITELNSSSVAVTMPIELGDLTASGFSPTDVGKSVTMSYVNSSETWTPLEGSITYVQKDNTGDGDVTDDKDLVMITGSTDHLTVFAVTGSTDTTPPAAPGSIKASDKGTGGAVSLSWTKPTDADYASVTIYRSTVSGTLGSSVKTGATGTTHDDTGLTNSTKYYYTVRSVDSSGNTSVNTAQVDATPTSSKLPKTGSPLPWFAGQLFAISSLIILGAWLVRRRRNAS